MTVGKWRREPDPSRCHRLLADVDWTRRYTAAVIADARQAGAEVPSRSRPRSRSGGDGASGWRPGPRARGSDHGTRARDQREPLAGRGDLLGLPPSEPRAHHRELPRARTGRWPWRSSRWRRRRPRRPSRWVLSGPGSGSRARSCARPLAPAPAGLGPSQERGRHGCRSSPCPDLALRLLADRGDRGRVARRGHGAVGPVHHLFNAGRHVQCGPSCLALSFAGSSRRSCRPV